MDEIVFVYAKKGKIIVLNASDANRLNKEYIEKGFKHTATLNACVYIQHLHNMSDKIDISKEIKSLSII